MEAVEAADVSGDGVRDLVAVWRVDGRSVVAVYTATPVGWDVHGGEPFTAPRTILATGREIAFVAV